MARKNASVPKIEKVCEQCGKPFRCWPGRAETRRFCTHECYGLSLRVPYDAPAAAKKKYRDVHRDELNAKKREATLQRRRDNPKVAVQKKAWATANRPRMRASLKRSGQRIREELLAAYGGKCACCGESVPCFLTLDHINGNGAEERRRTKTRGNQKVIRELKRLGWPTDNYRLLCWNCQFGVRQPGGCPHQAPDQAWATAAGAYSSVTR